LEQSMLALYIPLLLYGVMRLEPFCLAVQVSALILRT
jgi:hypothetical protein